MKDSKDTLSPAEVQRLIQRLASAMISDEEAISLLMSEAPLSAPSAIHHRKTSDYRTTNLEIEE